MAVSKEKMDSIIKDFEKLNANLEGLTEEELKEVASGVDLKPELLGPIAVAVYSYMPLEADM